MTPDERKEAIVIHGVVTAAWTFPGLYAGLTLHSAEKDLQVLRDRGLLRRFNDANRTAYFLPTERLAASRGFHRTYGESRGEVGVAKRVAKACYCIRYGLDRLRASEFAEAFPDLARGGGEHGHYYVDGGPDDFVVGIIEPDCNTKGRPRRLIEKCEKIFRVRAGRRVAAAHRRAAVPRRRRHPVPRQEGRPRPEAQGQHQAPRPRLRRGGRGAPTHPPPAARSETTAMATASRTRDPEVPIDGPSPVGDRLDKERRRRDVFRRLLGQLPRVVPFVMGMQLLAVPGWDLGVLVAGAIAFCVFEGVAPKALGEPATRVHHLGAAAAGVLVATLMKPSGLPVSTTNSDAILPLGSALDPPTWTSVVVWAS